MLHATISSLSLILRYFDAIVVFRKIPKLHTVVLCIHKFTLSPEKANLAIGSVHMKLSTYALYSITGLHQVVYNKFEDPGIVNSNPITRANTSLYPVIRPPPVVPDVEYLQNTPICVFPSYS